MGELCSSIVLELPLIVTDFVDHVSLAAFMFQKGDVPAAPSGTATLLRLSPNYQFYPRPAFYTRLQVPPAFMA